MRRPEIIAAVAEKTGGTKTATAATIEALLDVITETLVNGDKIHLSGFGTFEVRHRKPRLGTNPRTGERIILQETKAAVFHPGRSLKSTIEK